MTSGPAARPKAGGDAERTDTTDRENAMQAEETNVAQEKSFGELLKTARESAGMSLGDLSSRTKLSVEQLRSLEAEDLGALPEPVYVRAFIRGIAKALEIDAEPILLDYTRRHNAGGPVIREVGCERDDASFREVVFYEQPRPSRLKFLLLIVLVVLVSLGIWGVYNGSFARWMHTQGSEAVKVENGVSESDEASAPAPEAGEAGKPAPAVEAPPAPASAPEPAPVADKIDEAEPAAPAAVQAAPLPEAAKDDKTPTTADPKVFAAQFHTTASCWVHVLSPEGRNLIAREMKAGETAELKLAAGTKITVGHTAAMVLTIDGHPYDMSAFTHRGIARFVLN